MKYRFEIDKVIQAIGVLFRSDHVNRMSYLRLLKLLYIADRESMAETGWPITRDRAVAMDNGPVLSQTYDLIMGRHVGAPLWSSFFRKAHYWLEKVSEPDVGRLSKYEITKLQQVAQRHEDRTEWDMVEITHEFSEWKKNKPEPNSMKPIPFEDILEAVGKKELLPSIEQEQRDTETYDAIFGE
jgi:uncharacterized phage-associated protein